MLVKIKKAFSRNKKSKKDISPMVKIDREIKKYISQEHNYSKGFFYNMAQKIINEIDEDIKKSNLKIVNVHGGLKDNNGKFIHDFSSIYSLPHKKDNYGNSFNLYTKKMIVLTILRSIAHKKMDFIIKNFVIKTDLGIYKFNNSGEVVKKEVKND